VPALVFAIPIVYGRSFTSAAWLFVPLALVSIFQSINNPVVAFANGRRRGGLIVRAYAASLIVDVVVAVALIPPFGAWGAVSANVAGQLVGIVWLAVAEPYALGENPRQFLQLHMPFALGTAAGIIASLTGLALRPLSPLLAAGSALIVGSIVYLVVVRYFRTGLTTQDRDAMLGASASRARPYLSWVLLPLTSPERR
jgi:O-antigen/teichoic acid export membrane protein